LHWERFLHFPDDIDPPLSEDAKSLITELLKDRENRLGFNGAHEIKSHPFFKSVDWDKSRQKEAPFTPDLASDIDTTYFNYVPEDEEKIKSREEEDKKIKKPDYPFIGYTFKRITASDKEKYKTKDFETNNTNNKK